MWRKMFAHQNKEIEKLNEATNNPSLFLDIWKNIGEKKKEKTPPEQEHVNGNKWESFFKNLYSETNKYPEEIDRLRPNIFLDEEFKMEELIDTLKDLKSNKAFGLGKIKSEFIKAAPRSMYVIILNFANLMSKKDLAPKS